MYIIVHRPFWSKKPISSSFYSNPVFGQAMQPCGPEIHQQRDHGASQIPVIQKSALVMLRLLWWMVEEIRITSWKLWAKIPWFIGFQHVSTIQNWCRILQPSIVCGCFKGIQEGMPPVVPLFLMQHSSCRRPARCVQIHDAAQEFSLSGTNWFRNWLRSANVQVVSVPFTLW